MKAVIEEIRAHRDCVDFVPNRNAFVDKQTNKVLRGVSRTCKRVYYPSYKLQARKKGSKKAISYKELHQVADTCPHAHLVGSLRGSIVDQEISQFARYPASLGMVCKERSSLLAHFHPYTRKFLRAIHKLGWRILGTQVPAYDIGFGLVSKGKSPLQPPL